MTTEIRDASCLLLVHGKGDQVRFLMGLRAKTMVFMPGYAVFPGGREESVEPLIDQVGEIQSLPGAEAFKARLKRGCAAALRELREETGLDYAALEPTTPPLCFATATTPAFQPRRYSTLFFPSQVSKPLPSPGGDAELEKVDW